MSIIVPVYNVEKYIDKCLYSLANQTLNNIEIIIVNDGSTDNSQSVIDKYVSEYGDKMISFKKENGGLSDARNFGLKYANGEYIGFVDPDDWVEHEMYERLYDYAKERNADIVISDFIYEPESYITNSALISNIDLSLKKNPEMLLIEPSVCNKLFKKSLFDVHAIDFPKGLLHEDRVTIAKLFFYSEKTVYIGEAFYHYLKQREESITTSRNIKKFSDIIVVLNKMEQFFIQKNFIIPVQQSLETLIINSYFSFCIRAVNELNNEKMRYSFMDEFRDFILERYKKPYSIESFKKSNLNKKIVLYLLIKRKYTLVKLLTKLKNKVRG
ncbi:glycosyltransferase family 2 protein [Peribacillus simplex]|uniref:glycosyltransferase family 2 protein n=1 Tax=Peribacillus simplex TaxID=1478 RepID=UPI001E63E77F|nr:glycosyltransferase [Peribacillus simplex]